MTSTNFYEKTEEHHETRIYTRGKQVIVLSTLLLFASIKLLCPWRPLSGQPRQLEVQYQNCGSAWQIFDMNAIQDSSASPLFSCLSGRCENNKTYCLSMRNRQTKKQSCIFFSCLQQNIKVTVTGEMDASWTEWRIQTEVSRRMSYPSEEVNKELRIISLPVFPRSGINYRTTRKKFF